MAYTKTNWKNGTTPINETNLNKIENELATLDTATTDSGWKTATLTDDFKAYNDIASNTPRYRKIGKIVYLTGVISPASDNNTLNTSNTTAVLTMPSGYRPKINQTIVCQGTGRNIYMFGVNSSTGVVTIGRYRDENGYASTPPTTATWLPFSISYMVD